MNSHAFVPANSPWRWAVPLASALLLAAVWLSGANRELFFWFNGLSHYTGEAFWANATIFGDSLVLFALAVLLAGRRPTLLWSLLLVALLGTLFVHGLKEWVDSPRPAGALGQAPELIVIGVRVNWFSFPSGHSASVFAVAGLLCQPGNIANRWKAAMVVLAALVAASRMVVGAHWPLDVLAGAGGGWLCAVAAVAMARRWRWGLRLGVQRVLALLLVGAALALILVHDSGYPQARLTEIVVGTIALAGALPGLYRLFLSGQIDAEAQ